MGKIVRKNLEQPFLATLNLYQSFWGKLSEIIWKGNFWPFWVYTNHFGKNYQKKLEWPFLASLNLYKSFWEILLEKFRMAIFGYSKFIQVFLDKIVRKNLEWWFLVILNLYQSFWEILSGKIWNSDFWPFWIYTSLFGKNCQKKCEMAILDHFEFIPVIFGKIVWKNLEQPFLPILNLCQSF